MKESYGTKTDAVMHMERDLSPRFVAVHSDWHDSFICVTWLIRVSDMTGKTPWCIRKEIYHHVLITVRSDWHDSFIYVTWLIHMSDLTRKTPWCTWKETYHHVLIMASVFVPCGKGLFATRSQGETCADYMSWLLRHVSQYTIDNTLLLFLIPSDVLWHVSLYTIGFAQLPHSEWFVYSSHYTIDNT